MVNANLGIQLFLKITCSLKDDGPQRSSRALKTKALLSPSLYYHGAGKELYHGFDGI